ncbi:hypothetical protein FCX73_24900, partial [Escherichia coli]|nr:hypothetical protein [Escherichia coli]MDN0661049.1 hypothetical protein [Escherichia coli]MDN0675811.1 hypothetical protein [Escherichia coli]
HTIVSIKNDGHYFCRAGGNRPDGLNEPVTFKVLQLKFDRKLSNRTIGLTLNISPSTVFEVLARFKASSTPWPLPETLTPEAIESLIFPEKKASVLIPVLPDWLHIDTEMRRPGVTRQLLWTEYRAQDGKRALI